LGLSVSSQRDGAVVTLAVSGDVDLATSPDLGVAIDEALTADGVRGVELDLTGVEFLDSSGIAVLLKGRRTADERTVAYRVTGMHGIVRQVLELTGVLALLTGTAADSRPTAS
jgi:anti-anti-sigma factor